jgi:hypothetical protein
MNHIGAGEAIQGTGQAAGGLVTVCAAAGELAAVRLAPGVFRLGLVRLAEAFRTAANEALAEVQARSGPAGDDVPDAEAAARQIATLREESARETTVLLQALAATRQAVMAEVTRLLP